MESPASSSFLAYVSVIVTQRKCLDNSLENVSEIVKKTFRSYKRKCFRVIKRKHFRVTTNVDLHKILQPAHHHYLCHCQVPLPPCPLHIHYQYSHHLDDQLPVVQQEGYYQHQLPGEGQCPHPTLLPVPAVHKLAVDVRKL